MQLFLFVRATARRFAFGILFTLLLATSAHTIPDWSGFSGGGGGSGSGAPTDATYITQTANGSLSAEQPLGALATGCLGSTTTTGVVASRTITGTANNITVTNGDCSGNPTLDLGSTAVQTDQGNTWTTGTQDFGAATAVIGPKAAGAAPTADADFRFDTDRGSYKYGGNGITGAVSRVFCVSTPAADTLDAAVITTTETSFATTCDIPANMLIAGKIVRINAVWEFDSSATPPTLTRRMKADGTNVYVSTATATSASVTDRQYAQQLYVIGTAAAGASVNVITSALAYTNATVEQNTLDQPIALPTNQALTISHSIQYSAGTASNTMQLLAMWFEELN